MMKRLLAELCAVSVFAVASAADSTPFPMNGTAESPVLMTLPLEGTGKFSLPRNLKNGDDLTLRVRFHEKGAFYIHAGGTLVEWVYTGPENFRAAVWSEKDGKRTAVFRMEFNVRGVFHDSFSLNDDLVNWSKWYQYSSPELKDKVMSLRIRAENGQYEVYLNGFYTACIPEAPLRFDYREMEIRKMILSSGVPMKRFLPLDISHRFNTGIGLRETTLPEGRIAHIRSIPFFLGFRTKKNNALDVGLSWNRFVNAKGDGEEFGGRWGHVWLGQTASQNTPSRFQFRVPRGDYNALYVLAASVKDTPEAIDTFTVQFYRPGAGFPKNFKSPSVPVLNAKSKAENTIVLDGKTLSVIRVPLAPGLLKEFQDLPFLEFEITKDVLDYQCYPDPYFYSRHGGGLPSAVKIFAMTLEKSPLSVSFEPGEFANVWLAPADIFYTVSLKNHSETDLNLKIHLQTESWDGSEKTGTERVITLKPDETRNEKINLKLKKYGHHHVTLNVSGDAAFTQERTLSHLHPRKNTDPDIDGPGFLFGCWNWRGSHSTVYGPEFYELLGKTGFKAVGFGIPDPDMETENYKAAEKWHIRAYYAGDLWPTADYAADTAKKKSEEDKLWKKHLAKKKLPPDTPRTENKLLVKKFFAFGTEPSLGIFSMGSLPEFYGEKPLDPAKNNDNPVAGVLLSASKSAEYQRLLDGLKKNIPLLKKEHPDYKIMLPWGDPNFAIPFMTDPAIATSVDGVLYDSGVFDRMPEMQLHQTVIHRLWQFRQNWKKYSAKEPLMVSIEGPCFSGVKPGGLNERENAAYLVRSMLLLGAYGLTKQLSAPFGCAPASYWGEQHYGSGTIGRQATWNPYVSYSAVGTMVRHLEPLRFVRVLPLSSKNVYAVQMEKIANPSEKVCFLWTPRGTRPVKINAPFTAYDIMDNVIDSKNASLTVSDMPLILYGLPRDAENHIVLGKPEHSDSKNGAFARKLANIGNGQWKQKQEEDKDYTEAAVNFIRRFPAEMILSLTDAPEEYGGKALSVLLPAQKKNRGTMPHYTTLLPASPLRIPGVAKSLNFQVEGVGDWGRIVLVLRDAKGEKWLSAGVKDEWNCDDTRGFSSLNFEGWRLVKIPLPGNAPWDSFRLAGTASWAAYGGDHRVDYPLALEKIILERREQFLQINSMEPLAPAPVRLADVFAEYEDAKAMDSTAVRTANLRMPKPKMNFKEPNPIARLKEKADVSLPMPEILRVVEPETYNDGTNAFFHIRPLSGAIEYDVYVSRAPDGSGALLLGRGIRNFPAHIRNLKPGIDLYAFLVYRNKERKSSLPSHAFKLNLKKNFGNL